MNVARTMTSLLEDHVPSLVIFPLRFEAVKKMDGKSV